jgi:hypothetical protein
VVRKYAFFFQNELVVFQKGDFAAHNRDTNTLAFLRGCERIYTGNGDDKIRIEKEDGDNIPIIIEIITGLTPVMRDENGDIVIYELMEHKLQ